MTVSYVAMRYLLIPLLYVPYKLGVSARWASRIDFGVKRAFFPLTERANEESAQEVTPKLKIGDPIPAVNVKFQGQDVALPSLAKNRPFLLVIYRGSWCPYSRMHMSNLAESHQAFIDAGVDILAVSTQQDGDWWKSKGVNLPLASDPEGKLFEALGVNINTPIQHRVWGVSFPHESVFLFDRDSKLVATDVRRVSNSKLGQTFLSATKWLDLSRSSEARG